MEINQERIDKAKSDDLPVTERVKTFDDAVRELGENHPFVNEYNTVVNEYPNAGKDVVAYMQLRIIVAALNEGWEPKFEPGERRWTPYFSFHDEILLRRVVGGLAYAGACYADSNSASAFGSRLAFKTEDLAIFAGIRFRELYQDFLMQP